MIKVGDVLKELVEEFGKISFSFWHSHMNNAITFESSTKDGREYQVDIRSLSGDPESITILFEIAFGSYKNVECFYYVMDKDNNIRPQ